MSMIYMEIRRTSVTWVRTKARSCAKAGDLSIPAQNLKSHCASIRYNYDAKRNEIYTQYYRMDQKLIKQEAIGAFLCFLVFDALDMQMNIKYYI